MNKTLGSHSAFYHANLKLLQLMLFRWFKMIGYKLLIKCFKCALTLRTSSIYRCWHIKVASVKGFKSIIHEDGLFYRNLMSNDFKDA